MKSVLSILTIFLSTTMIGQITSSHLPVINIQSNVGIPDEPRIDGTMGIMSTGGVNNSDGPFNEYNGNIGIETRGNSSQDFEKKSYTIELRDNDGQQMSQSLLGMGADSEWVLHALFIDKTLLRIPMSFYLHEKMGEYACRWQYVEVVVNGDYKGVYALIEKIRQGLERLNIAAIDSIDNSGGYILKMDWIDPEEASFQSEFESMGGQEMTYEYIYPRGSQITDNMENYIKGRMFDWESALFSENFRNHKGEHYTEWMERESFSTFFLINEFSKNSDGYKLSSFIHKNNDQIDPRFHAGPIWDFDQTYGLSAVCSNSNPKGWTYLQNQPGCHDHENMPMWWESLTKDDEFCNLLVNNWSQYRASFLQKDSLFAWIDSQVEYLDSAIVRNFNRWDIINEDVWVTNYQMPGTYKGEVVYMKKWIEHRLAWIDNNIGSICAFSQSDRLVHIFPNPTSNHITVKLVPGSQILIADMSGRIIVEQNENYASSFNLDVSNWRSGVYIVYVKTERGVFTGKFVKSNGY